MEFALNWQLFGVSRIKCTQDENITVAHTHTHTQMKAHHIHSHQTYLFQPDLFTHNNTQFLNATTAAGYLLIAIWTYACSFIIFCAIIIGTIVEGTVPLSYRSSASLILEMPIEAHKWTMLVALVLQEGLALFHSEFLQISISIMIIIIVETRCKGDPLWKQKGGRANERHMKWDTTN